jgi:hypothetical protein
VNGRRALLLASAAFALCGCAVEWQREHPLGCRLDEQSLVRDTLYFGASIPGGGEVDAEAWRQFEEGTLARAFPQGYTVTAANGAWRGDDGVVIHEATRVVTVVHADTAQWAATLRRVTTDYHDRFHQQSVLHEHGVVCARF